MEYPYAGGVKGPLRVSSAHFVQGAIGKRRDGLMFVCATKQKVTPRKFKSEVGSAMIGIFCQVNDSMVAWRVTLIESPP